MKTNRVLAVLAAAVITLGAVPLTFAARSERREARGLGEHGAIFGILSHAADELELSEAQRAQLKTIARQVREENAASRQEMRGSMKEVASLLIANPNNVAGAEALLDENDSAREQMRSNILRGVSQALNVLTPAQRDELGGMIDRFGKRSARF